MNLRVYKHIIKYGPYHVFQSRKQKTVLFPFLLVLRKGLRISYLHFRFCMWATEQGATVERRTAGLASRETREKRANTDILDSWFFQEGGKLLKVFFLCCRGLELEPSLPGWPWRRLRKHPRHPQL